MSHLLQMRGLKLAIKDKRIIASVASFTDAWIETMIAHSYPLMPSVSHLLQMRGLKPYS